MSSQTGTSFPFQALMHSPHPLSPSLAGVDLNIAGRAADFWSHVRRAVFCSTRRFDFSITFAFLPALLLPLRLHLSNRLA
jgi:hypothetical protein